MIREDDLPNARAAVAAMQQKKERPFLWVDRRHPFYATFERHWTFLWDSFVGGPDYVDNYLFQFWREDVDDFSDRRERAYRYNYTKAVIDIITSFLWQSPPARETKALPQPLQSFWKNADREGNPIDLFMAQKVSPRVATWGRIWAVVDKPKEAAPTRAQELEKGLFPYVTIVSPLDFLDARFENGELIWALLRQYVRDDLAPQSSSGEVQPQYKLWEKDTWSLYEVTGKGDEAKVEQIDKGVHDLGIVPIVPIDYRAAVNQFVAPSLVWDLAYLDRSIMNHISLLDAILYDVTFPQLAIPWQAIPPGTGQDPTGATTTGSRDGPEKSVIKMATKKAFTFDATSPKGPAWLAPDSGPVEQLRGRIKEEIDELFKTVSLQGEMAIAIREISGITKEHEFRKLNKLLASMGENHESAEQRILKVAARWVDADPDKIPEKTVDYADTFDVKTLLDELEEIKQMQEANIPELVINEARADAMRRRFAKMPAEELQRLIDTIRQQKAPEVSTGGG